MNLSKISPEQKSRAKTYVEQGRAAWAQEDFKAAESAFGAALNLIPNFATANYYLGRLLLEQGNAADAEPVLQKAAHKVPSPDTHRALAECHESLGKIDTAAEILSLVLQSTPEDAALWGKQATLLENLGKRSEAIDAYRQSLKIDPKQPVIALKFAWVLWRTEPDDAVKLLEKTLSACAHDQRGTVQLLSTMVVFREWKNRITQGKAPYHASALEDLFFSSATEELNRLTDAAADLLKQNERDHWARMMLGLALFAAGDTTKAQEHFEFVGKAAQHAMLGSVRFNHDFFELVRETSHEEVLNHLPNVEVAKAIDFDDDNILYMSCNADYFDAFAVPLLRSLANTNPATQVHIHLMDSSREHSDAVVRFCIDLRNVSTAVSVERNTGTSHSISDARAYYHAIRFIRFYEHILTYQKTLWLMDVDAIFNRSPHDIFSRMGASDIAMRIRPGRLEPWNQFNACLVGVRPTDTAKHYIRSVCAYIFHFFKNGSLPWGIDQLAMYSAFLDMQQNDIAPQLSFLDETVLDYDYIESGILWCSSGTTKYKALSRNEVENDPDATAFDKAFAKYSSPDTKLDPA